MNYWTEKSIEVANQDNYLDKLHKIYSVNSNNYRTIDKDLWNAVARNFNSKDDYGLIDSLLKLPLFPIKDPYVSYLRRDKDAIFKNPGTIRRLCREIYSIDLTELHKKCTEPKEANRQMGSLFKKWINKGSLGSTVEISEFVGTDNNAVLNASDMMMKNFARDYLGYNHHKGLDFVGRFNNTYVIGEAKFLTDFGGHQHAQFNDSINTVSSPVRAISVAILDGIPYIKNKGKIFNSIKNSNYNIMSALVFKDFLDSL